MINKLRLKIHNDIHLAELIKGSSTALVLRVIGLGFGYIFTLIITRGYGAKAMGIFALSFTVLQISSVIGRLGMDTALLRFVAEYSSQGKWEVVKDVYKKALKLIIPFSVLLSLSIYLTSPYLAKYIFHKEYLYTYFRIASLGIAPFVLIFINSGSLRGLKKIKEYVFLQNIGTFFFSFIFLWLMTYIFYNSKSTIRNSSYIPLTVYIISVFIIFFLSHLLWLKHLKPNTVHLTKSINSMNIISSINYKTLLSISTPMLLSSSLAFIMQWTDTIMLGMFRTEAEVGIYAVALKVSMITSLTLFAINSIAAPKFAEFYGKGDIEGLGKVAQQSTKLIFWTSFPVLLIFFIFPSFILGIFGEEFKAGAVALIILTFGQFVNAISGSVGLILQMSGKQNIFQNIIVTAAIINIFLNSLFIPKFGIIGAAFASMLSMVFWNISSLVYIKKYFGFYIIYIPKIL